MLAKCSYKASLHRELSAELNMRLWRWRSEEPPLISPSLYACSLGFAVSHRLLKQVTEWCRVPSSMPKGQAFLGPSNVSADC